MRGGAHGRRVSKVAKRTDLELPLLHVIAVLPREDDPWWLGPCEQLAHGEGQRLPAHDTVGAVACEDPIDCLHGGQLRVAGVGGERRGSEEFKWGGGQGGGAGR